jgi:hypothetical protein
MKPKRHFLLLLAGILALSPLLRAQSNDNYEVPPMNLGGFDTQGSAEVGYRFTDVRGFKPMYKETVDLETGPRMLDFNMFGEAREGANPFADSYSLSLSGLGGDPFPTAQFVVTKRKLFDLRVNWRQAYYFWNQNDNVILPITAAAPTLSTGLTDHHNWDTVRKFGSADLTLHATNSLRFNFNYYRTTDNGATFTTASPDFLGSPSFWGGYARANPYYLFAPINDETNRFTGGLDYTYHSWTVHYTAGYQTFSANTDVSNVTSPEFSINPAASSGLEPLSSFTWTNFRRLTTPISELSFVGKPRSHLEWRGSYLFYRYQGPVNFDQSYNGVAPNATNVQTPYAVSQSVRATLTEPDHIVSQGFTYDINSWWSVSADYRYSHQTSTGMGTLSSLFNATTPTTLQEDIVWRNNLSDLDIAMDFTPVGTLVIRPGVRLMKADIVSLSGGVADPILSHTIKTARPEISIGYEPSKKLSIRGDLHNTNNGFSYTSITPHTQTGGRVSVKYHPFAKFSIDDELNVSTSKLLDTNYRNSLRANALTFYYALNDRFSIFTGFSYQSFFAEGDIVYARGPAPLHDFLTDQEINRVWQGGVEAKPTKRLAIRFSGNFDRSTGEGRISGEPPAYGPVTWPLATGTLSYNFPKAGRLSIDLQRTYYLQEIVPGNNFSGNLLTVRWSRDF